MQIKNLIYNPKEWVWKEEGQRKYLQSELLNEFGFTHGFFTKQWSDQNPNNLINLLGDTSKVFFLNQIHSNIVLGTKELISKDLIKADGIFSNKPDESIWIYSADCIPVLIADRDNGAVCACHAGWKGIKNGVIINSIKKLIENGSKLFNLLIAFGPAISRINYQIDKSILTEIIPIKNFKINLENNSSIEYHSYLSSLGITSKDLDSNKLRLDIRMAAAHQLISNGINTSQISLSHICTYSEEKLFNSWRRDGAKNFNWSGIKSRKKR